MNISLSAFEQYVSGWLPADGPVTIQDARSALGNALAMLEDEEGGLEAYLARREESWQRCWMEAFECWNSCRII